MKINSVPCASLLVAWLLTIVILPPSLQAAQTSLSLAGQWRFQLDADNKGENERWFERSLADRIVLPGALQNQGFGDDITTNTPWTGEVGADRWLKGEQYAPYRQPGNIKVPFFLQPEKHYVGAAWYQRDFELPNSWQSKRIVFAFERAHWETRCWVDGQLIGTNTSLSTPHVYDLGTKLAPGKHTLTIRIDNHMLVDVGSWAHSVSDHTQGNWNGMIGRITLHATDPVWIDDLQVYPHVAAKSVTVKGRMGNASGKEGKGIIKLAGGPLAKARGGSEKEIEISWTASGGEFQTEYELGERAQTWDEFNPRLCKLTATLDGKDSQTVTFGLREITTQGRQFVLNGRPTFFRGTLECCIFPLTGYPPTDVDSWKKLIRACQSYGLNHIRFHSWCPPEAAFVAADELGFYFSVEIAAWTRLGDGKPIDQWLYVEADRILRAYGNHPSFMLMPYGNEPNGPNHIKYLAEWVTHWKAADSRRLYTSGSAYPHIPENQYHVAYTPRGPGGWLGRDYRKSIEKYDVPVIVHEMGQWCVYPNFDEVKKYTGPLKPKNFDIFRDSLIAHGMKDQWRDFLRASGKLQVLCYKEEIEAAFRTPGIGGVQLLDLHDFPGQGTALVGVLDPFWSSKGYVTGEEYRRFYNTTVPLARLMKRTWTTDENLTAELEVAHYGAAPLDNLVVGWEVRTDKNKLVSQGEFPVAHLPLGQSTSVGTIDVDLSSFTAPGAYRLVARLNNTAFENDWNFWVYPALIDSAAPSNVLITSALDDDALGALRKGVKVLWLPKSLSPDNPRLFFEPIFWNRYMFNTQAPQTLGLLVDPKHPALAEFPTQFFQDWQWQEIVTRGRGLLMDNFPPKLRPIVQVIDDWNTNRRLGLMFECRVGPGRLMVCATDLEKNLDTRPAARQFRRSLLAYLEGPRFNPQVAVTKEELMRLLQSSRPSRLMKLEAKVVSVDSEHPGYEAIKAFDSDPDTIWHTRYEPAPDPMPHQLALDLGREVTLKGLTYLPRQDMSNGRVSDCEIFAGNNPNQWGEPIAKAKWGDNSRLQTVRFAQPVKARYLKLLIKSEVRGQAFAAIAELDIISDDVP